MASSHLSWLIVRDHNAFIIKRRAIKKPFSKVIMNSTMTGSYKHIIFYCDDYHLTNQDRWEFLWRFHFATSDI